MLPGASAEGYPERSPDERRDVVVVGAGLAGLAAARALPGRDVLLLEAENRLGGRLHSDDRAPYWLNWGAHLFGGSATPIGELIEACGVETLAVDGSISAIAFPGKLIKHGRPLTILRSAPLPWRARVAFVTSGLGILRNSRKYRKLVARLDGRPPDEVNRLLTGIMSDRTFADVLGPLPPELDQLYRAISNRAQAEPEQLSAGSAMSAFELVLRKSDSGLRLNVAGGSARFVDALARGLHCAVRTGSRVTSVAADADGVTVNWTGSDGQRQSVRAKHAIVTTPPHITAGLVQSLPDETATALRKIRFGPSIVMALLTREQQPMPWDDLYSAVVPGRSFNMFFNQANVLRSREASRQPGGSLMVYASGALGRRLLDRPDSEVQDLFLSDLYDVFPQLRGLVAEVAMHRWEYATSYSHPGRAELQPALDRDLGRVQLAGDYLGAWFTDSAVLTGRDAAQRAERQLAEQDRRPTSGAAASSREVWSTERGGSSA